MNETALREQLRKDLLESIEPCRQDHSGDLGKCPRCQFNDGIRHAASIIGKNPDKQRGWVVPDFVLIGAPASSGHGKMLIASKELAGAEMIREVVGIDRVPVGRGRPARLPVIRTTLIAEIMQFGTVFSNDYRGALETFLNETVIPASEQAPLALPPRQ